MKPIHKKRLLKLIAFLRKLPRKQFDFFICRKETKCGTVACAIGWTPEVFPRKIYAGTLLGEPWPRLREGSDGSLSSIGVWLTGLCGQKASDLFHPMQQSYVDLRLRNIPETATPKQVAAMLEKFIKLQETEPNGRE